VKNKLLGFIIITTALLGGCNTPNSSVHQANQPKFVVTADIKNDPIPDITPSLITQLSVQFVASTGHNQKDFKKVVNIFNLDNGIVYVGRVKNGFCVEYVEKQTGKIYFLQEVYSDDESKTVGFQLEPVQAAEPLGKSIVFFASYNFPTASEVIYQWADGQITRYHLVNGTVLLVRQNKQLPVKTQLIDNNGNDLLTENKAVTVPINIHVNQ